MKFVYNKPLSIEQLFSMINKNGGEKIDKEEADLAKNVSIFKGFIVEENMTLQDFEAKNRNMYSWYERSEAPIVSGDKFESESDNKTVKEEKTLTPEEELALDQEKVRKETLINLAKENGISFSDEEIQSLSFEDLSELFGARAMKRDAKKLIDDEVRNMSPKFGLE